MTDRRHELGGGVDEVASRDIELGNVAFTDILGVEIRPEWRGGIVRVAGHVSNAPAALRGARVLISFNHAYIDVRIVGYVGSKAESIHRAAYGENTGAIDVVIDAVQAYRRIAVLARLVVDGLAIADPHSLPQADKPFATANAVARFVR